mmetsp:Transcript_16607/g.36731  ORF Transcript_16607/g.36731 Transcript_16607/m.36731 type:complete len:204 (-) Transcript_16607:254-865(-)
MFSAPVSPKVQMSPPKSLWGSSWMIVGWVSDLRSPLAPAALSVMKQCPSFARAGGRCNRATPISVIATDTPQRRVRSKQRNPSASRMAQAVSAWRKVLPRNPCARCAVLQTWLDRGRHGRSLVLHTPGRLFACRVPSSKVLLLWWLWTSSRFCSLGGASVTSSAPKVFDPTWFHFVEVMPRPLGEQPGLLRTESKTGFCASFL